MKLKHPRPTLPWELLFLLVLTLAGGLGLAHAYTRDRIVQLQHPPHQFAHHPELESGIRKDRVSFIAIGDQGTGDRAQKLIARYLESDCSRHPDLDFVMLLGDNFYHGGVASSQDEKWDIDFESVYNRPCLANLPFYAALGNHDYDGDTTAQVEYSKLHRGHTHWHMPAPYYVQNIGQDQGRTLVRMVVLDTQRSLTAQRQLLQSAFANSDESVWKIVVGHVPIHSFDTRYGDNQHLKAELLPLLKTYGVHMYLSGHAHNLQLIHYPGEPLQVVSGSAGGRNTTAVRQQAGNTLVYSAAEHGFVRLEFSAAAMTMDFISENPAHSRRYQVSQRCAATPSARQCSGDLDIRKNGAQTG